MKSERIGRFSISRAWVEHDAEAVRAVMGRCVVVRCELALHPERFEYTALSPEFDEVSEGAPIPEYDVRGFADLGRVKFIRRKSAAPEYWTGYAHGWADCESELREELEDGS